MVMQSQRLYQSVVSLELPVYRLDEESNSSAAFRTAFNTAMTRTAKADVVAIASILSWRTVIIITTGYNPSV